MLFDVRIPYLLFVHHGISKERQSDGVRMEREGGWGRNPALHSQLPRQYFPDWHPLAEDGKKKCYENKKQSPHPNSDS